MRRSGSATSPEGRRRAGGDQKAAPAHAQLVQQMKQRLLQPQRGVRALRPRRPVRGVEIVEPEAPRRAVRRQGRRRADLGEDPNEHQGVQTDGVGEALLRNPGLPAALQAQQTGQRARPNLRPFDESDRVPDCTRIGSKGGRRGGAAAADPAPAARPRRPSFVRVLFAPRLCARGCGDGQARRAVRAVDHGARRWAYWAPLERRALRSASPARRQLFNARRARPTGSGPSAIS